MKTFEITKEQILELCETFGSDNETRLRSGLTTYFKCNYPQAFESELEVGKWYKWDDIILFITHFDMDRVKGCGVNCNHWFDFRNQSDYWGYKQDNNWTLATDKEVETALIEEAKRRYNFTKEMIWEFNGVNYRLSYPQFSNFNLSENELFFGGGILFSEGKWAEIINEPLILTIDEIAEKFGTTADKIKICK